MLRGEVRLVDLGAAPGASITRRRPAVVVSNDGANLTAARLGRGVVTVVPVTTDLERVHPFQVLLPASATAMPRDCKAQAEQVRAVAVARVGPAIGRLSPALLAALDDALRLHLAL